MQQRIVVIGAGQAGASLVAKLRALGHEGPLTLVGNEPVLPYQRPPLSKKYLMGEMDFERLLLRPPQFYEENAISVMTGAQVSAINRDAKTITIGKNALEYDFLALTTGSSPRTLPLAIGGALGGVYTVRNLADVNHLAPEFQPDRRVLVVGGGYIGLEAAAVAAQRGLEVTLIELAPRILNRVAADATASFFRDLHRSHGVDLREGVGLDQLNEKDGRVAHAALTDGTTLDVDFVIAGIGVAPSTELAASAGLALDNGIAVDGQCRTSDASIYSAGDCASFNWGGQRIRLESVQNAIDQAEHAAAAMLGDQSEYTPSPWFWSDQYDCKMQIAGLNSGYDFVASRAGSRPGGRSVWYFADDRLLAVDAMNDPKAYMSGKRWLEAGLSPNPGKIADDSIDLRDQVQKA